MGLFCHERIDWPKPTTIELNDCNLTDQILSQIRYKRRLISSGRMLLCKKLPVIVCIFDC